ncbi:hypothetical protein GGX14DRAFT_347395 [Mycena pura]|uniref:BTB domain-containing protein n=1 Tax=Mycena pura TaxID=153505 RepID=A0AAD6YR10_9AGAR|nr:hypothetical protein GGX14DRAFT_347395 [Mycena pura]
MDLFSRDSDSQTGAQDHSPQNNGSNCSDGPLQSAPVESSKRSRALTGTRTPADLKASGGPTAKRARSSCRRVTHWDLDGDIFLRIEDCWMRVRKGALATHSGWFADLFAAIDEGKLVADPKRPYDEGTIILADVKDVQKCYHVPALGLSSADLELLLSAVDDAISYCHNSPPFLVVSAIFRAATVLKFTRFRDWAQRSFQDMWPPSLSALSIAVVPHATEAVILGRSWGLPSILKRALYELLRTPGFGQNKEYEVQSRPKASTSARLQPADIMCLVRARECLDVVWYAATSFDVFSQPRGHAREWERRCTSVKYETYKRLVHDTGLFVTYRFDVLCGLETLAQIDWDNESAPDEEVCPLCASRMRERWHMDREQAWETLDVLFRLMNLNDDI